MRKSIKPKKTKEVTQNLVIYESYTYSFFNYDEVYTEIYSSQNILLLKLTEIEIPSVTRFYRIIRGTQTME